MGFFTLSFWSISILYFASNRYFTTVKAFNSFLEKDISANITCGSPKEVYYRTQDGELHPRQRTIYVCDAEDPEKSHPPVYMIDNNLTTFWQSTASEDRAVIRINLNQEVFGYKISMTFGDYRRPKQMAIRKSKDYGATFEPWHYLVSPPASEECREVFGMEATANPDQVDTVICQQYPSYFALEYDESFSLDMNGQQRGDGSSDTDYYTSAMLVWMKITNLEFEFTGLYQKFDSLATAFHHYTVREISLTAKCNCHGYANGHDCVLKDKIRKCDCQGNTCGLYCQQCCPAYNQYPWQPASGAPWLWNGTSACEACNCHNHSDSCIYNETVASKGLSLNIHGERKGGGVCTNCMHNTDGTNCETCKPLYYRPLQQSLLASDSCKPCDCNNAGSAYLPNMTYLDCVRDEQDMLRHPSKKPGDCFCKRNVIGRTCDTCQDGFYKLSEQNINGCQDCECDLAGTVNGTNVCEKDDNGKCYCKVNTKGRACGDCKEGFFNLDHENIDGCEDCGCDPGATVPGTFCDDVTGVCQCLPHINGRQCKSVEEGWYYPTLHFISATRDIYSQPSSTLNVTLKIPKRGAFRVMLKYSMKDSDNAMVDIHLTSNTADDVTLNSVLQNCAVRCYQQISSNYVHLDQGLYAVFVNTTQSASNLETIIAIPQEFYENTVLGNRTDHFNFQCNVDENDMRVGANLEEFCLSNVFSLTVAYNNGPLSCGCDRIGSYNHTTCEAHGGQCYCKPGVTGRDCSQCLPEYYNLSEEGCTSCECQGANKVCNVATGWCECPLNTALRTCEPCMCNGNSNTCLRSGECLHCENNSTGFYCEECQLGTYGNASLANCIECKCDEMGSLSVQCDVITGECLCKKYVTDRDCSTCVLGTYNMSDNGCEQCQCNVYGSTSPQCDDNGQCPCNENVNGLKCTQCSPGYYGLPTKACQACDCNVMGSVNGTQCASDHDGQCVCKPGVTGRACDRCQKQYTNFTAAGCTRCTGCSLSLQNIIDNVILVQYIEVSQSLAELGNFSEINSLFLDLKTRLENAQISSDYFSSHIDENVKETSDLFYKYGDEYSSLHDKLTSKDNEVRDIVRILELEIVAILQRLSQIKNETEEANEHAQGIPALLDDVTSLLALYVKASSDIVITTDTLFNELSSLDVKEQKINITDVLNTVLMLSEEMTNVTNEILSAEVLAEALEISLNKAAQSLEQYHNEDTQDEFISEVQDIYGSFTTATALVENIKNINRASNVFIDKAAELLGKGDLSLSEAEENVDEAHLISQQYKDLNLAVQGEVEISMLQYDFKESVFLMKILQARDLLARDFPSGTSDPYAIITILPAWRGQGSQTSRIINGTTSPIFPLYDIYRFDINVDEIPLTKLVIKLYDYDGGTDETDDCLGEVVVDLSQQDFFDKIVTKWFTVRPKDVALVDNEDFEAKGIGLPDLTTLLQLQVEEMSNKLNNTENLIKIAETNTTNLKNAVEQLNTSLQDAFRYTRQYRDILYLYNTTRDIANNVFEGAEETERTISWLNQFLEQRDINDLIHEFEAIYHDMEEILASQNNTSLESLYNSIKSANDSLHRLVTQKFQIDDLFVKLKSKISLMETESTREPAIRHLLTVTNDGNRIWLQTVAKLTTECHVMLETMDGMTSDMVQIFQLADSHGSVISEGIETINKAETLLNTSPTPGENILTALPIHQHLTQLRDDYSQRISILEEQTMAITKRAKTLNLSMHFHGNSALVFKPTQSFVKNKLSDNIWLDFKTNSSQGGLIYIVTSAVDLSNSVRIFVDKGNLCWSTDMGLDLVTLCHPDRVDNGEWYRALFTRYERYFSLTLVKNTGQYSTVNSTSTKDVTEVSYNDETVVYAAGLPPGVLTAVLLYYDYFDGVMDHVHLKGDTIHLWSPLEMYGEPLFHCNRCFPKHHIGPFYEGHFYGTGGVWQRITSFDFETSDIMAALEFRTFQTSGVLLELLDVNENPVFGVYLINGTVKGLLQTESEDIIIHSSQSSYDDGLWYLLNFTISDDTISLQVQPVNSSTVDINALTFDSERRKLSVNDSILTIGASSRSDLTSLSREAFAGDLRNIKFGNGVLREVSTRDLVGYGWIKDDGVDYDGVIDEIMPGYRFNGYLPRKGYGSYVMVEHQPASEISHLQFTFKTSNKNGLLLYGVDDKYENTTSAAFYIAIWEGYMYFSYNDENFDQISPFYYTDFAVDNNMWHSLAMNMTEDRLDISLNGETIYSGWPGNARAPLVLKHLYVGGVSSDISISIPVPVYWSFEGDFQSLIINDREMELLSGESRGVSRGGVAPAVSGPTTTPPTTIPPTTTQTTAGPECAGTPHRPNTNNDKSSVSFGGYVFGFNTEPSFAGFTLNDNQKRFFDSSLVIVFEFRSLSLDGLIMYAADSASHPQQYISLELVNGRLIYQFRSATGQVTVKTLQSYALRAHWYKVYLLRIGQLGAIVVPSTREYPTNRHANPASPLAISTPVYIGGLPSHVTAPSLTNRRYGFIGCLRNFQFTSAEESIELDMMNPDVRGADVRGCNDELEPGAYFNGNASMEYDNVTLNAEFTIRFRFRTNKQSGVLFVVEDSLSNTLALYQKSGELILEYKNNGVQVVLNWIPEPSPDVPSSHKLCQMQWYSVEINSDGSVLRLVVNNNDMVKNLPGSITIDGGLILGEMSERLGNVPSFAGCIQQVMVNGRKVDLSRPTTQTGVELSCRVPSTMA